MKNLLQKVSANPENPNWNNIIKRQNSPQGEDGHDGRRKKGPEGPGVSM